MLEWSFRERWWYGVRQSLGLGFLAAAFEAAGLAASSKLPLSAVEFVLSGLVVMGIMALWAGLLGAAVGAPVQLLRSEETPPSQLLSLQIAGCGFGLVGTYLWPGAWEVWSSGASPIGAGAMAAMPIGFAGVIYFNARYLFRRVELGHVGKLGWLPASSALAVALIVVCGVIYPLRDTGGAYALEGDKNVVLITVDGLRHDQLGYLGGLKTPAIDALAAEGVRFNNAVTPLPHTRASLSTVLVGLHPLRHKVLRADQPLSRRYRSIFEVLEQEGWATGGFVSSSAAVVGSGLDQGFRVYDDDFRLPVPGLARWLSVRSLLAARRAALGPQLGRRAATTVDRFETWMRAHQEVPFAAWIQLSDPHQAARQGRDPAAAVHAVDDAVGRVLKALREVGASDRTVVVFVSSHGELLGAHGGQLNETLFDEVVRVPLIVRVPEELEVSEVGAQVRLMDVANTVLVSVGLDPLPASEGIALNAYWTGKREATVWCSLVGQDLRGGWLLGMRNNGVKYVRLASGREVLFNVVDDPEERTDLSAEQEGTLEQARALLASESVALKEQL